jgi:hypothetical protein
MVMSSNKAKADPTISSRILVADRGDTTIESRVNTSREESTGSTNNTGSTNTEKAEKGSSMSTATTTEDTTKRESIMTSISIHRSIITPSTPTTKTITTGSSTKPKKDRPSPSNLPLNMKNSLALGKNMGFSTLRSNTTPLNSRKHHQCQCSLRLSLSQW